MVVLWNGTLSKQRVVRPWVEAATSLDATFSKLVFEVGPGRYHSLRHRLPFKSRQQNASFGRLKSPSRYKVV